MEKQKQAAFQSMSQWLADERELGKAPAVMECAGEFDLYEMHYYIFRYKKSRMGKWLLGVCGGYDGDSLEHCGHVFSEMEAYNPDTAQEKAIQMVEEIRAYWMEQAAQEEHSGSFTGFVLLNSCQWDKEKLLADLLADWNIDGQNKGEEEEEEEDDDDEQNILIFETEIGMVVVSLFDFPVPEGEAERNAANNFMWPEAVEVTKTHQAHLVVAILDRGVKDPIETGKLFSKVVSSCLKQENAIGVYTSGTVFAPDFYRRVAQDMKEDCLPVLDWIYFGIYPGENGINGYTYGMNLFGKPELEVLESQNGPQDVYGFLVDVAFYILDSNVTLQDGETIGFSAEQKLPITLSPGVSVEGDTLKIGF